MAQNVHYTIVLGFGGLIHTTIEMLDQQGVIIIVENYHNLLAKICLEIAMFSLKIIQVRNCSNSQHT